MRRKIIWLGALLAACGTETTEVAHNPGADASSEAAAPTDGGFGDVNPDTGGEEPLGPPIGAPPAPVKLADDAVIVMGMTSDDWVIYRSSQGIVATRLDASTKTSRLVSAALGVVQIRGPVVFVFSNVDWDKKVGELTLWTAAHGAKSIGPAVYGEDLTFATPDGAWVGWLGNVQPAPTAAGGVDGGVEPGLDAGVEAESEAGPAPELRADLVLATPALENPRSALTEIGIGSAVTCRPRIGFFEQRLIAAWCAPGSASAALQMIDPAASAPLTIADHTNAFWSADVTAQTLFYTDLEGGAWVVKTAAPSTPIKVDNGVGWGALLPDASALLYSVGDQLRRSQLPNVAPLPIITNGFVSRAGFTPDYAYALYSTKMTYEAGGRRNLLLTPTDQLNDSPRHLLDQPIAEISRSLFTSNGKWLLYLTNNDADKTLFVRSIKTDTTRTLDGVDTVVAGRDSRLIYSTHRSGPETYPITADLAVMDPTAAGDPVTLHTGTTDGRAFHLSSDGSQVVYTLPAQAETPSALFAQAVP